MKVAKWGNGLAIRLSRAHVQALDLREGDEVDIPVKAIRKIATDEDARRDAFLRCLDELGRPGPQGF